MYKRIISFVLVIATVFCFAVPTAFAATEYYSEPVTWGEYILTGYYKNAKDVWDEDSPFPWVGTAIKSITTTLMYNKICEQSHDGYHASLGESISHEAFGMDEHGRYCLLSCDYCGEWFRCYSSDLISAHDEYVNGLDSTIANTSTVVTGFTCTKISSTDNWFMSYCGYNGYMTNVLQVFRSLGIFDKVAVPYAKSDGSYIYGYYFDSNGQMMAGCFRNPLGSFSTSLFGVYKLTDLVLVESAPVSSFRVYEQNYSVTYSSASYSVFYSKEYAEAISDFSTTACLAFDWESTSLLKGFFAGGTYFAGTGFFVSSGSSSDWKVNTSNYFVGADSLSLTSSDYYVDPNFITWDNSRIIVAPTGADATTRTGSLMQTINNYNVDNSVVDNSSNVNYYISPKSYVTELPDDTIDIEQCYSPQSYDEETLVFTEPVTGAQILTSGWTYNYETRTYDIDVPSGTTTDSYGVDITRIELIYGDEAVTYNYYLADDTLVKSDEYAYVMVSGDENFGTGGSSGEPEEPDEPEDPGEDPEEETHKHSYTSTVTTDPTCEAPGIRKYTCSECGDSYTEKISAAGHTWTVKQTVATQYDDSGSVTVQGYTIYKCSVCNTEYKDEAGTGPPNNSADSGDGEGIFKKFGQLLGSILSGLLGMIEAVLGGLLDGLVRLADLVGDKLTQVVEIVTGLFDKIPQLFGGFTALLADVFVFIPEDIMTIFTFGAAAIVFVGILMFFIKR